MSRLMASQGMPVGLSLGAAGAAAAGAGGRGAAGGGKGGRAGGWSAVAVVPRRGRSPGSPARVGLSWRG